MIFLVPYAYDRMPGGNPRKGVPANRLGSKARCDALLSLSKKLVGSSRFILAAGFTKKSPCEPTGLVRESISDQMCLYLLQKNPIPDVQNEPCAWGTYEETRESIGMIWPIALIVKQPQIYVSTNLGHMPRVWLCWFFLKPKGWKIRFIKADHSFTWKERGQETIKFFVYLCRFLFRKWPEKKTGRDFAFFD